MKNVKGFTLIEMLVVIAIISILATIALPSYSNYVLRSHRAEAREMLMSAMHKQENYRLDCPTYAQELVSGKESVCEPHMKVLEVGQIQSDKYKVEVSDSSNTGFTLMATALNEQAKDKDCGIITLVVKNANLTAMPEICWK